MLRNAPHKVEVFGDPVVEDLDGLPGYTWTPSYVTHGWLTTLDAKEQPYWEGQSVEASVRLPRGEPIAPGNRVKVDGLDYVVVTTRPNPMGHTRAMLRRNE